MIVEKRSNFLDIIKGLMIIFIIITHFRFAYPDDYMKYGFFYWVDMAVPVFMIITGYLIALSMKNINSLWQAYRAEIVIKKLLRFLIPWLPIAIVEAPILVVAKNYNCFEILKQMLGGVWTWCLLYSNNDTNDFSWTDYLLYS